MNRRPQRTTPDRTLSSNRAQTNVARLHAVLEDGDWHSTRELVRRVSHTFAVAKFKLTGYGYQVAKRRHPDRPREWQYRMES